MNETIRRFFISTCGVFLLSLPGADAGAVPDNLYFHGTLVDEPCTIHPGCQ